MKGRGEVFFSPDFFRRRVWALNVIPRELQWMWTSPNLSYWSWISHWNNVTLVLENVAHDNNRAALFLMLGIFILRLLLSMNNRHGEMDWWWTVFTLLLNFQFTCGSPSSYDLFHGSAYTGVVHRHRNRWVSVFIYFLAIHLGFTVFLLKKN